MSKAKLACKCKSISESVLGDGCDICNPDKDKGERIADIEHQREVWKERAISERDKNKDLEQQLAEMRREYDSLMDENISVAERNVELERHLAEIQARIADYEYPLREDNWVKVRQEVWDGREQQLADVGSINLRLMEQLAEANERIKTLEMKVKGRNPDGTLIPAEPFNQ